MRKSMLNRTVMDQLGNEDLRRRTCHNGVVRVVAKFWWNWKQLTDSEINLFYSPFKRFLIGNRNVFTRKLKRISTATQRIHKEKLIVTFRVCGTLLRSIITYFSLFYFIIEPEEINIKKKLFKNYDLCYTNIIKHELTFSEMS